MTLIWFTNQIFRDSRTVLNLVKNDYEAQEKARIIVAEFPDNVGFLKFLKN